MDASIQVRQAADSDLQDMLQLFEICLRSDGGSPSPEFWRWKHQQNPFGSSPVLLAFHQQQLVGLRAFLRWNWEYQGNTYASYRAVDTATHPQWQGKGIFRQLTTALWTSVQQDNPSSFVFNTPNARSKPGYLKMGWQVLGKPRARFVYRPATHFGRRKKLGVCEQTLQSLDFTALDPSVFRPANPAFISSQVSAPWFHWRYQQIPDRNYAAWVFEDGAGGSCLLIFYLRKRKGFTELRICNRLVLQEGRKALQLKDNSIRAIAREFSGCVVTALCHPGETASRWLQRFVPEVTLRMPDRSELLPSCWTDMDHWQLDMGSLELF